MVDTRYQDLRVGDRPVIEREGVCIDLVSGAFETAAGPALNHWPMQGSIITLDPNTSHEHVLPGHHRAFVSVLSGEVIVGGRAVQAGQTAWSDPVPPITMFQRPESVIALATGDADRPSVAFLCSGQPIGEPVAMGGPFVMNTQAEITRALNDYRADTFGDIPRQARLNYL